MEPLWSAKDQAKRLAELTAGTGDPEKETPLRRDVRSLGTLLGAVLREQAGGCEKRERDSMHNRIVAPHASMVCIPPARHLVIWKRNSIFWAAYGVRIHAASCAQLTPAHAPC